MDAFHRRLAHFRTTGLGLFTVFGAYSCWSSHQAKARNEAAEAAEARIDAKTANLNAALERIDIQQQYALSTNLPQPTLSADLHLEEAISNLHELVGSLQTELAELKAAYPAPAETPLSTPSPSPTVPISSVEATLRSSAFTGSSQWQPVILALAIGMFIICTAFYMRNRRQRAHKAAVLDKIAAEKAISESTSQDMMSASPSSSARANRLTPAPAPESSSSVAPVSTSCSPSLSSSSHTGASIHPGVFLPDDGSSADVSEESPLLTVDDPVDHNSSTATISIINSDDSALNESSQEEISPIPIISNVSDTHSVLAPENEDPQMDSAAPPQTSVLAPENEDSQMDTAAPPQTSVLAPENEDSQMNSAAPPQTSVLAPENEDPQMNSAAPPQSSVLPPWPPSSSTLTAGDASTSSLGTPARASTPSGAATIEDRIASLFTNPTLAAILRRSPGAVPAQIRRRSPSPLIQEVSSENASPFGAIRRPRSTLELRVRTLTASTLPNAASVDEESEQKRGKQGGEGSK